MSKVLLNKDFRTDTDFWTKAPKHNPKLNYVSIGSILKKSQYGISIEMNESSKGYPIYRMNEIHNMLCDFDVNKCADIDADEFKIFSLNDRDVLFNRTNSYEWVGRTGLYRRQAGKNFVFASYLVRFVPDDNQVLPEYLVAFLSSRYGVWDIRRRARHSINQTNVNPEEVKEIQIPLLTKNLQDKIKSCFDDATKKLLQAERLYRQAENEVHITLGITESLVDGDTINIKNFKNSFLSTGRLDAEYYQPKFERLVASITAQRHAKLSDLVSIQKSIEPGSEAYDEDAKGLPFLRVADYSKQGITQPQVRLSDRYVEENAEKIAALKPKQDTILFSKDGSVGEAYRLREDANFITSGAILHLTVKNRGAVLSDYLTLVLNSIVVKQQAERDAGGSIILHWRKEEIENVLVPIVDMQLQKKIAANIQKSFTLKAESEHQLEIAKHAVEIAIEQDEASALLYINTELLKV